MLARHARHSVLFLGLTDREELIALALVKALLLNIVRHEDTPAVLERLRVVPAVLIREHNIIVAFLLNLVCDLHWLVFHWSCLLAGGSVRVDWWWIIRFLMNQLWLYHLLESIVVARSRGLLCGKSRCTTRACLRGTCSATEESCPATLERLHSRRVCIRS